MTQSLITLNKSKNSLWIRHIYHLLKCRANLDKYTIFKYYYTLIHFFCNCRFFLSFITLENIRQHIQIDLSKLKQFFISTNKYQATSCTTIILLTISTTDSFFSYQYYHVVTTSDRTLRTDSTLLWALLRDIWILFTVALRPPRANLAVRGTAISWLK